MTINGVPTFLNGDTEFMFMSNSLNFFPIQGDFVYPTLKSATERIYIY